MLDKLIKFIKDTLIPKKCYSCRNEGHFLCDNCTKSIHSFNSICYICKLPSKNFSVHENCKKGIYFDNLIVLYHYRNKIIKKLILDAKFYHKKDIFEDFGYILSEKLKKNISIGSLQDFIIIPTPLHFLRKMKRGYNQAEIIASGLSKNVDIKIHKKLIYKVKHTRQQSQLSKIDRVYNLNNSFKINKKELDKIDNYKNKTIILVDDVISTGTTLNQVSKLLKKHGCKNIVGLVIASD